MSRVPATIVLLSIVFAGCRTCDSPYDYCGPVVDSEYHPAGHRAGGLGASAIGAPIMAEPILTPPPTPPARPRDDARPETPPVENDLPGPSVMTGPRSSR